MKVPTHVSMHGACVFKRFHRHYQIPGGNPVTMVIYHIISTKIEDLTQSTFGTKPSGRTTVTILEILSKELFNHPILSSVSHLFNLRIVRTECPAGEAASLDKSKVAVVIVDPHALVGTWLLLAWPRRMLCICDVILLQHVVV